MRTAKLRSTRLGKPSLLWQNVIQCNSKTQESSTYRTERSEVVGFTMERRNCGAVEDVKLRLMARAHAVNATLTLNVP